MHFRQANKTLLSLLESIQVPCIINIEKKAGEKCSTEEELDASGEDSEKSSDIETNDEVYGGYHFSSFIPLFYSFS